jgi:hypothetical protein
MAGPTLPDCRLPKLRRHHRATAWQAQTRTYPRQRSSTGSRFPYRFRPDTGPCVGTGEGLANSGKRFEILKPLLNMGNSERTFVHVKKAARALGKHPATVYRWIENYGRSERLSVFLRKERSDRGTTRLATTVEKIIDAAIKKIYLKAERPDVAAVIEEVNLQRFKSKITSKPAPNTIRARVFVLSDRLKMEKREGKKVAAAKYEPIKGHFPGADYPLAVAQIDHTPNGRHCGR